MEEETSRVWLPETPGPIQLQGSLHETIWGGSHLAEVAGKAIPAGVAVGESWETALDALATNAPYAGHTLGALVDHYGPRLIGLRAESIYGRRFPLLAKFLDANAQLSVQVHPEDAYASEHESGKLGKTEMWYILRTEPGATLVYGLKRAASPDEVRQAIAETRLEDLLHTFDVHAGDVVFVPAGTVHAIGAGVVLYELQEYSDITYRLYDYGRLQSNGQPRELHVERGLDVLRYERIENDRVRPVTLEDAETRTCRALVACPYFVVEELHCSSDADFEARRTSCEIMTVLEGACEVRSAQGGLRLGIGETAVLPAGLGAYTLVTETVRLIRSYVPDENDPVLERWKAAQSPSPDVSPS